MRWINLNFHSILKLNLWFSYFPTTVANTSASNSIHLLQIKFYHSIGGRSGIYLEQFMDIMHPPIFLKINITISQTAALPCIRIGDSFFSNCILICELNMGETERWQVEETRSLSEACFSERGRTLPLSPPARFGGTYEIEINSRVMACFQV